MRANSTRTRSRAEYGQQLESVNFLSSKTVKVRKWQKEIVTYGKIRIKKWTPEHSDRNPFLKDTRPVKSLKGAKKLRRKSSSYLGNSVGM